MGEHRLHERYAEAEELAGFGLWEWFIDDDRAVCSDGMLEILGTDSESFSGSFSEFLGFVHPDDRDKTKKNVADAFEGNGRFEDHEGLRIIRKDGDERIIQARGRVSKRGPDGTPLRMLGVIQDITGQRRIESELVRLKFMLDKAGMECFITDDYGRFVYVNEAAAAGLGYTVQELTALSVTDIDLTCDCQQFHERFRLLKQYGHPPFETYHKSKSGEMIPKELKAVCLEVAGKDYLCVQGQNITGRRKAEQQREDLYAMLEHDLKSPVTVILGGASMMDGSLTDNDLEKLRDTITGSCRKISDILNNRLTITKIEGGRPLTLTLEMENLSFILLEAGQDFGSLARNKGITLTSDIGSDLPVALFDKAYIQRAVSNLLMNAIQHTKSGGNVTLSAEPEDGGNTINIRVKDDGCGIPADEHANIFDKYYRSSSKMGSGLGLSIVKAVVEAHGGRVSVESEPGKGSTFMMRIPVRKEYDSQDRPSCLPEALPSEPA